mgnify:CR=1 FL=1
MSSVKFSSFLLVCCISALFSLLVVGCVVGEYGPPDGSSTSTPDARVSTDAGQPEPPPSKPDKVAVPDKTPEKPLPEPTKELNTPDRPVVEITPEPQKPEVAGPDKVAPDEPATPDKATPDKVSPDKPTCGKLGQQITSTQSCCSGLSKLPILSLPTCRTASSRRICAKCGDGKCDAATGENYCNCSRDCKRPPQCTKNENCGKPTCTGLSSNRCIQYTPTCIGGRCSRRSGIVSGTCNKTTGKCGPPTCKQASDCPKRTCRNSGTSCTQTTPSCVSGLCQFKTTTLKDSKCNSYNQYCYNSKCTSSANCGRPACRMLGTIYCYQYTPTCTNGACTLPRTTIRYGTCNTTTGLCAKPKACKVTADCGKQACKQASSNVCSYTGWRCDTRYGCVPRNGSLSNYVCNTKTNACEPKKCTTIKDCVAVTCRQYSSYCRQYTPTCTSNRCGTKNERFAKGKCESNGTCTKAKCTKMADCGSLSCRDYRGNCELRGYGCFGGYCGDSTVVYHAFHKCNTTKRICEPKACTTTADCGKPTCANSPTGAGCMAFAPKCVSGKCQFSTTTKKGSYCSSATQTCR